MGLEYLLPDCVLSVGLVDCRDAADGLAAPALEDGIAAVLGALQRGLPQAAASEARYFSAAPAMVRMVTTGDNRTDMPGVKAAARCGVDYCCITPFLADRGDTPGSAGAGGTAAETVLQLSGRHDEGRRAVRRAMDVLLANVELVIAIRHGAEWSLVSGTGDAIEAALERSLPVIVIDPQSPDSPAFLGTQSYDVLTRAAAVKIPLHPLPAELSDFIHAIIRPPRRLERRQGLDDLLGETDQSGSWRIEYALLLKLLAPRRLRSGARSGAPHQPAALAPADPATQAPRYDARRQAVKRSRDTLDALAVRYGQLFRSSCVSQYLIVMLGAWIYGILGLLFEALLPVAIVAQVLANGVVLADLFLRQRGRWQERWLDYRVLAEQLRWLDFCSGFGIGAIQDRQAATQADMSWTDWLLRRWAFALGLPSARMEPATIKAAADHLIEVETPGQIQYHRNTSRQLSMLERRLTFAAYAALASAVVVVALLGLSVAHTGGFDSVTGKSLAVAMLTVLPATMTALSGLRVETDLVRLAERSAQTVVQLFRIRRAIRAAPENYDHVAAGMAQLAALMKDELDEWRFVIESRRARNARRQAMGRANMRRLFRAAAVHDKPSPRSDMAG
jgi:hypothetical protein